MRIAYLSNFYPFRGGIAQGNGSLFRIFEKEHNVRAFNFSVQYPDFLFPSSSQYVTDKDLVDKIPSDRILNTINPFSYLKTGRTIKKFDPELIISRFWIPFMGPALGTPLKMNKQAFRLCILDNAIPHETRIGDIALSKYFYNNNDHFVVMSNKVKEDLLSLMPNAQITSYFHPIFDHYPAKLDKTKAREILNLPQDKKLLLYFGFIRDYKGLDILIEAMKLLDESYHLVIAGDIYGSFDKYDKMIGDYNLSERVSKFIRYIDDDEVAKFFSAVDLSVLPYKDATQSGVVGVCFNYDLPVVATNVGGLKEVISEQGTGLITDEINSDGIVREIKRYFNNDKEPYIEAIARFRKIASWEGLAGKVIEIASDNLK